MTMKYIILGLYAACILFVHFRGKARLPFFRQIFDHSSVVSPINIFIYLFSKVPTSQAYIPVGEFKGLKLLEDNWEIIRDEALEYTPLVLGGFLVVLVAGVVLLARFRMGKSSKTKSDKSA